MPSLTGPDRTGPSLTLRGTSAWALASRALRWRVVASTARYCFGGFLRQPVERRDVVDVAPKRQFDQVETQRGRALPRLRRDSVGAPGDVGEQSPMGSPHAEEIMRSLGAIRCQ